MLAVRHDDDDNDDDDDLCESKRVQWKAIGWDRCRGEVMCSAINYFRSKVRSLTCVMKIYVCGYWKH